MYHEPQVKEVVDEWLSQLSALLGTFLPHPLCYGLVAIRNEGLNYHSCSQQKCQSLLVAQKFHARAATCFIGLANK